MPTFGTEPVRVAGTIDDARQDDAFFEYQPKTGTFSVVVEYAEHGKTMVMRLPAADAGEASTRLQQAMQRRHTLQTNVQAEYDAMRALVASVDGTVTARP